MRALACIAALILASAWIGAEEPASYEAGLVDVEAEAYSPAHLAPAASVTVIEAKEIEASGASNAAEALEAGAGVWVNRAGPGGAAASASLRSATSAQVLVVLDGVRLNDARQGGFDLSLIPASSIERIEVLKGGASAVYGADALGGVIVITTKKAKPGRFALSFQNLSYPTALAKGGAEELVDGQSLGVEGGFALGEAEISASGELERASGSYPYKVEGERELRENAGLLAGSGRLAIAAPLWGGRGRAELSGLHRKLGVPGMLSSPTPEDAQKDSELRAALGWSSDALAGGDLSVDLLAHGAWTRVDYADDTDDAYDNDTTSDFASLGLESRDELALASWANLGFGFSAAYEAADSTVFEANDEQPGRFSLGAYAEPELRLGDRLSVTPALRLDWSEDYAAGFSAMLNAVYRPSEELALKLSGGRSYRAPTFIELYWPYTDYGWGYSYEGNPDLDPERSWSAELGAELSVGSLSLSAAAYARWVEDLIVSTSDSASKPVNLSEAFVPGAELVVAYAAGPLSASAGYEFAYPLDLSGDYTIGDDVNLENVSRHKLSAQVEVAIGAASAGLSGRYWSERTLSFGGEAEGALILGLRGAYEIKEGMRLGLAVENLLDEEYAANGADYPMPGLAVKTSFRMEL
ncbi:MAG TPA: TonB-dependent receptor [Spirochaetales bacterium]|nr:TonB-dependent receptor [Spirochaetales bacterium]HRY54794.1 TonB-dependent receptor [Spirochaetia bacterium]HRZ64796.1 TonB-dependent receptor [Spirochaetia bacterium]